VANPSIHCQRGQTERAASCLYCMQTAARAVLEDDLHIRYGQQLFGGGTYEEAMAHFGMCSSANPVVLLRLFPSLAPDALLKPVLHLFPGKCLGRRAEPKLPCVMTAGNPLQVAQYHEERLCHEERLLLANDTRNSLLAQLTDVHGPVLGLQAFACACCYSIVLLLFHYLATCCCRL